MFIYVRDEDKFVDYGVYNLFLVNILYYLYFFVYFYQVYFISFVCIGMFYRLCFNGILDLFKSIVLKQ